MQPRQDNTALVERVARIARRRLRASAAGFAALLARAGSDGAARAELRAALDGAFGFEYEARVLGPDGEPLDAADVGGNLIPSEGLNAFIEAISGGNMSLYAIASITGSPTTSWTHANGGNPTGGTWTEWTDYNEAARPTWSRGAVSGGVASNTDTVFTLTAASNGQVVRAVGLATLSVKGSSSSSGRLVTIRGFATDKNLDSGQRLRYAVRLTVTAA